MLPNLVLELTMRLSATFRFAAGQKSISADDLVVFAEMFYFREKTRNFAHLQSNLVILLIFFTKIAITQPKKVKIQKILCIKSSTNIWPSFRNIYSVPKVIKK